MKKETVTEKMIKHFYGITGPMDEYKHREADRIGNICFIYLTWLIMIGNVIALFLSIKFPKFTAIAYPIFLMFGLFIIFFYVMLKVDVSNLTTIDEEELTPSEQKKMKNGGLKASLFFGFFMYLFSAFQVSWSENKDFLSLLLRPLNIIIGIIMGILFGLIMSLIVQARKFK